LVTRKPLSYYGVTIRRTLNARTQRQAFMLVLRLLASKRGLQIAALDTLNPASLLVAPSSEPRRAQQGTPD
jgi:hypothetical protein